MRFINGILHHFDCEFFLPKQQINVRVDYCVHLQLFENISNGGFEEGIPEVNVQQGFHWPCTNKITTECVCLCARDGYAQTGCLGELSAHSTQPLLYGKIPLSQPQSLRLRLSLRILGNSPVPWAELAALLKNEVQLQQLGPSPYSS